jgi:predicted secreted protein
MHEQMSAGQAERMRRRFLSTALIVALIGDLWYKTYRSGATY